MTSSFPFGAPDPAPPEPDARTLTPDDEPVSWSPGGRMAARPERSADEKSGRLAQRLSAVIGVAYGNPTPTEAAMISSLVQVILDGEAAAAPAQPPEAYRSTWRRVAIIEGLRRSNVS